MAGDELVIEGERLRVLEVREVARHYDGTVTSEVLVVPPRAMRLR